MSVVVGTRLTVIATGMERMAEIKPEIQDEINKTVKSYPGAWKTGVCAFRMIDPTTGLPPPGYRNPVNGDVCHAALSYYHKGGDPIVINAHKPDWYKTNPDFMRWVARESPFARGVLNSDDEVFNHASVLDCREIGTAGALWLCKAFRHFVEDTWKPATWTKLREAGLDGLQAFVGADILLADGSPSKNNTHVSLFCYRSPCNLRKDYDRIKAGLKLDGGNASSGFHYDGNGIKNWGSLAGKKKRKADGWGGYTMVSVPCEPKEYVETLREILEGDPKNVK